MTKRTSITHPGYLGQFIGDTILAIVQAEVFVVGSEQMQDYPYCHPDFSRHSHGIAKGKG